MSSSHHLFFAQYFNSVKFLQDHPDSLRRWNCSPNTLLFLHLPGQVHSTAENQGWAISWIPLAFSKGRHHLPLSNVCLESWGLSALGSRSSESLAAFLNKAIYNLSRIAFPSSFIPLVYVLELETKGSLQSPEKPAGASLCIQAFKVPNGNSCSYYLVPGLPKTSY